MAALTWAGRRIAKTIDDEGDGSIDVWERYVWDFIEGGAVGKGNVVLDLVDEWGGEVDAYDLRRRYLWGQRVDQILAQEEFDWSASADDVLWMLTDNLGSVRDVVIYDDALDETNIHTHYVYQAFGEITAGDTTVTRYTYTAQEFDYHIGAFSYDQRWYDALTGQFMSPDPVEDDKTNDYRYVNNSPTNGTDSTGLFFSYALEALAHGTKGTAVEDVVFWTWRGSRWIDPPAYVLEPPRAKVTNIVKRVQDGDAAGDIVFDESVGAGLSLADKVTMGQASRQYEAIQVALQEDATVTQAIATTTKNTPIINIGHRATEAVAGTKYGGLDHGRELDAVERFDTGVGAAGEGALLIIGFKYSRTGNLKPFDWSKKPNMLEATRLPDSVQEMTSIFPKSNKASGTSVQTVTREGGYNGYTSTFGTPSSSYIITTLEDAIVIESRVAGKSVTGPAHKPVSGSQWYELFRAKYGAENVEWVSGVPKYAGSKTSGVLNTGAGDVRLISGMDGPAASFGAGTIPGRNGAIMWHVEAHSAATMRILQIEEGTLFINRVPCGPAQNWNLGCENMLPRMLPEGSRLRVVGPDGYDSTFIGLAD